VKIFEHTNVFLSLGSNIGEKSRNLLSAISTLDSHPEISILTVSSFYETEPLYNKHQPDFLNCAVKLITNLQPDVLLSVCKQIEQKIGRRKSIHMNESRPIDIDIIFFGEEIIHKRELNIPHQQYAERKFVLAPLNDISPDFVCPDSGETVDLMLQRCPDHSRIELYTELESI